MKFLAVLFAAAAAVATVSAADCPLIALAGVAASADATQCGKDADGYSVVSAKYPSATQLPKMCASTACNNLLVALKKAAPTECDITLVNPAIPLYATLLTPIETYCEKWKKDNATPTTPAVTPAPGTPTSAPGTPTTAPVTPPAAC